MIGSGAAKAWAAVAGATLAGTVSLLPSTAFAQGANAQFAAAPGMSSSLGSQPLVGVALLGLLGLIPIAFMSVTSYVKMSVVLSILRSALGTGQVPSGMIIAALSTVLTLYVMAPVGRAMLDAMVPTLTDVSLDETLTPEDVDALIEAARAGAAPLERFLGRNAGARERALFLDLARRARPPDQRASVSAADFLVVLPAFLVTELAEAFQIGFLIFIPFLVIDMVVANVLLALGMHMLSPTTVSLPFKLLLFVAMDGFYLLARALVLGYA